MLLIYHYQIMVCIIVLLLDVSMASGFKEGQLTSLVIGNKADLREDKTRTDLLTISEIEVVTSSLGVPYQEISAVS